MKRSFLAITALFLLFGGGLLLAADQARQKLEREFSQFLHVPVRIQRLTFSGRRTTLHRIRLDSAASPLSIDRLQIEGSPFGKSRSLTIRELNLSLAGIPLWGQGRLFLSPQSGGPPAVEGWLTFAHPWVSGRVEVAGPITEPVLLGWAGQSRFGRRHFVGRLSLADGRAELQQLEIQGGWRGQATLLARTGGDSSWSGRLKLSGPDGRFDLELAPIAEGWTRAVLWAHRDGLAAQEFLLEWRVRRSQLEFRLKLFGSEAALEGEVTIRPPFPGEVRINLQDLKLRNAADWLLPGLSTQRLGGRVWGRAVLSGTQERLVSDGELSGMEGQFGLQRIDGISLRFQGVGPILQIRNSHLLGAEGPMAMEGAVDLRRIGQPDFFRMVKLTSVNPGVEVAGWQVRRGPGGSGVQMHRAAKEDGVPVGLSIQVDQEEKVVGLEHRSKF